MYGRVPNEFRGCSAVENEERTVTVTTATAFIIALAVPFATRLLVRGVVILHPLYHGG